MLLMADFERLFPSSWQNVRFFGNALPRLLLILPFIFLSWLLCRLVEAVLERRLRRHRDKRFHQILAELFRDLRRYFIPLSAWAFLSRGILHFEAAADLFLKRLNSSLFLLFVFYQGGKILLSLLRASARRENHLKEGAAQFYSQLLRVTLALLALLTVLSIFGIHVSGMLTGLGLGGLAISLAAQDSLSNFIAGLILMGDTGLAVGEEISAAGIEGTLMRQGLRSSQIRAYDRSLIVVPNKSLAEAKLINFSRSDRRRVQASISLPLEAPEKELLGLAMDAETYWKTRPKVLEEGRYFGLDEIRPDGLVYLVRFFINGSDYASMMEEKQKFLMFFRGALLRRGLNRPAGSLSIRLEKGPGEGEKDA